MVPFGNACGNRAEGVELAELVVVLPRDAEELDPRFVGDPYGLRITRLLFASLVRIDPHTLEIVPDLAESIEMEAPTRYRVVLREGLRFSDGSVLDAMDVRATFESLVDPGLASRYRATYQRIDRIEVVSGREVVFRLREPHATFLSDLEMPILRAEDRETHVGVSGHGPLVGAGPFRLVRREPGHLRLEANPRWHRGPPRYRSIQLDVVRDDNTRALRLLAGKGDLAIHAVSPLLLPMFEDDPRFEIRSTAGVSTLYLGIHNEAPFLSRRGVRHAILQAIDRQALVDTELGGFGRVAHSWIPPGHWASDDLITPDYDAVTAEVQLEREGLVPDADGVRAEWVLRVGADRFRVSVARAIAEMLRRVGVRVEVRPSETATLVADLNRGRFDLCLLQVPEVIEPHVLTWFFSSDRIPGPNRSGGANRWRFRSPALDDWLERGRATPVRAHRIRAYREAQAILADELPVIPLFHEDVVAVIGRRAGHFDVPRDGRFGTLAEPRSRDEGSLRQLRVAP